MITKNMAINNNFEEYIETLSKKLNEPEWVLKKRLDSFKKFKTLPNPRFTHGLNIGLKLDIDFNKIDIKNTNKPKITIKNNNKKILIEDYQDMLKNHEKLFKEKFMKTFKILDKFTSFHSAFFNHLTFVYIPKNIKEEKPIEIISDNGSGSSFGHLMIIAEDNADITLVENCKSVNIEDYNKNKKLENNNYPSNKLNLRSKIVEIYTGKNSTINYGNVQSLSKNVFNIDLKHAVAGENSEINWIDICFGSKTTLSDVTTYLNGKGSKTNNFGLFFGNLNQQFDLFARSIHNAPETQSNIFTKGVLKDSSKCLYRGLVKIDKIASNSDGFQKEDTLLLSSNAAADSIPKLEIDNNEVRCTHGATIGRIDSEKLFYLQSRGLDENLATREYVSSFLEPLIQKITIKELKDDMHKIVKEKID